MKYFLNRKLHLLEKNVLPELPEEGTTRITWDNGDTELNEAENELHTRATQILQYHANELQAAKERGDTSYNPLSTNDQALIDAANRRFMDRILEIFQVFTDTFVTLKDPMANWVFYTRFYWLIEETRRKPKGISTKQLRKTVHDLYVKAGFIKPNKTGTMYDLRVHSIRKFFKTQMLALGVQPDYVDYFMGHTVDTYHDIQSLGIDRMRAIYAAAGLAIRKKTQISKLDTIKEMIRALGENPEQLLSREALSMGNISAVGEIENHQLSVLTVQLGGYTSQSRGDVKMQVFLLYFPLFSLPPAMTIKEVFLS